MLFIWQCESRHIVLPYKGTLLKNLLVSIFPGEDSMSLQMRVSLFHVIFNVTTTLLLLPFVKQLVHYSCLMIKDKKEDETALSLKYVDDRLLNTPPVALMQVKKEMDYMLGLVEENTSVAFVAMDVDVSPYYSSVVVGLERVADHLVNVGYSIVNPTGSQKED